LKFKNIFSIAIILLIAGGWNAVWGQNDEGRPMRAVRQSSAYAYTPNLSAYAFLTTENSMLTEEVLSEPLTQYYIAQYSSAGGIAWLNSIMERGNIYMPFIMEEVAKRNLPPELAYLPVIESAFQITARSRSGAVGLWQFMMNSISPYDMKVTFFVDERRDFIKSTRGALQKLEDNYKTLGNWELALAAYNCGLGAATRASNKVKSRDYWEICKMNELKRETINYVPKFLAAAYILSQPRRFGIDIWRQSFKWTEIPLKRQVSIDLLASEAGVNVNLLRNLNAELLHGISPAGSFNLKAPVTHAEQINMTLEREDLKLIRYHYHVVRHGDTLWSMSRHYETPIELIEQHNPRLKNRYLQLGETIIIPAFKEVKPYERETVTYRFDGRHAIQKGDTLWSLGLKYNIDPQVLAEENGMELNSVLREGRTIKVPIIQ
jgi:membrane-bound lytic murein transglycosylase D